MDPQSTRTGFSPFDLMELRRDEEKVREIEAANYLTIGNAARMIYESAKTASSPAQLALHAQYFNELRTWLVTRNDRQQQDIDHANSRALFASGMSGLQIYEMRVQAIRARTVAAHRVCRLAREVCTMKTKTCTESLQSPVHENQSNAFVSRSEASVLPAASQPYPHAFYGTAANHLSVQQPITGGLRSPGASNASTGSNSEDGMQQSPVPPATTQSASRQTLAPPMLGENLCDSPMPSYETSPSSSLSLQHLHIQNFPVPAEYGNMLHAEDVSMSYNDIHRPDPGPVGFGDVLHVGSVQLSEDHTQQSHSTPFGHVGVQHSDYIPSGYGDIQRSGSLTHNHDVQDFRPSL